MDIDLYRLGRYGINLDQPAHELDPEWWTDAKNVRFQDGDVVSMDGHSATKGVPTTFVRWLQACPTVSAYYWLYAGLTATPGQHKFYCINGTTHTDVTPGAGVVTGSDSARWNGGVLNGIPFINNGLSVPYAWTNPGPATALAAFATWKPGYLVSMYADVLRAFGFFLVALKITENGTYDPQLLRWSHPAAPGTLPSSWDDTDATKDAGRVALAQTNDFLVDLLPLGRVGYIYKERSIYSMTYIGGNDIFSIDPVLDTVGMINRDCGVNLPLRRQHFVVGGDDIYLFNGQTAESIVDQRIRKFIFNSINGNYINRCWAAPNYGEREVWFAYPTLNSPDGFPDMFAIYNYKDNTWSFRDVGDSTAGNPDTATFGTAGFATTGDATIWSAHTGAWMDDTHFWVEVADKPSKLNLIFGAGRTTKAIYTVDRTNQFDDFTYSRYVERAELAVIGKDREGNWVSDPHTRKLITELFISAVSTGTLTVRMGGSDIIDGPITWGANQTFNPNTQFKVDSVVQGKYIHFRISSTSRFRLKSVSFNITPIGRY